MLGWLRETLASAPSSLAARHSTVPSTFFRRQKSKERDAISSDDDETNPSNENSFYHNPYHSSGQMNYVDVPQQQYTNEHTYPTYLARQQTSNLTLDDQIHSKLVSLQHRSGPYPAFSDRQNSYAYRNRPLPRIIGSSTVSSSSTSQRDHRQPETINDRSDDNAEDDHDNDDDVDNGGDVEVRENNDDDDRSSSIGTYPGLAGYRSGRYTHDDEQFDFASVVLWYRNVMQSVKKIL